MVALYVRRWPGARSGATRLANTLSTGQWVLNARNPRVAWYVARLPLASAAPVIPGASTRENVEPQVYARQRGGGLSCGSTWGSPGDGVACCCG